MTMTTTTAPDALTFTTAPTAPFTPTPVVIGRGTLLAIRWAGVGGVRGGAASHRTETVVAMTTPADGRPGAVLTLTGGAYRDGATTRDLNSHTANGRPSSQILDAWPIGAVVAALAAVMGATPADADADAADDAGAVWCDGCELCDADAYAATMADDAADADHDAADAAADDDGATLTTPATMTTGGAVVAAPMVGAAANGHDAWDRVEWARHYRRAGGAARRAYSRGKRATRRAVKRADRRDAIRDAWADAMA